MIFQRAKNKFRIKPPHYSERTFIEKINFMAIKRQLNDKYI